MSQIVLQTESLSKQYGSLKAVNHLSLEIFEGEVFGFLGPNGAGKTTSINMICGLLKPDSGQVLIQGKPITNGASDVRRRVGVCPQNIVLWERLTCLEQLIFIGQMYDLPEKTARARGEQLLKDLDLEEKRSSQARTLSGGMQRRLNLAMALVHDPDIVVLDEPEAGLDPQSRVKVRSYIQSLAHKKTVILTTHNMDEAERVADRIAIIDHGELLVLDTPEALKQSLGAGDIVEIQLRNHHPALEQAKDALKKITSQVTLDPESHVLRVRALHAVGNLAAILADLTQAGFEPGEVNIRANTLEDVFIQLTGRRLRE
ncbi:MAG TPA: ABC transporter ATP-binding protein [Anaerolineaceae bacterium]|nr:ABC transporter ATP-binding protein [Anaerolineaceae bacterium]HPN52978.1 ABC transporter ATP-binding protein [Anaerolineaceae bacterium]